MQDLFEAFSKGTEVPKVQPVPKVEKPKPLRTVGDSSLSVQAQLLFNPQLPQKPKAPSSKMMEQGSAPAMDTTGAWGGQQNG